MEVSHVSAVPQMQVTHHNTPKSTVAYGSCMRLYIPGFGQRRTDLYHTCTSIAVSCMVVSPP